MKRGQAKREEAALLAALVGAERDAVDAWQHQDDRTMIGAMSREARLGLYLRASLAEEGFGVETRASGVSLEDEAAAYCAVEGTGTGKGGG